MNTAVHFSSATCEWATPQWLFDALHREFAFTLDPCADRENAKCPRFFTREDDGLAQNWADEIVFMNPPYGGVIGQWMRKAYESSRLGATVVCLVPARTDTAWWHHFAMRGEVRLLRGRLKFGTARNSAPFPSAVVIFRPPSFALKGLATETQRHGGGNAEKGEVMGKQRAEKGLPTALSLALCTLPLSAHRNLPLDEESARGVDFATEAQRHGEPCH